MAYFRINANIINQENASLSGNTALTYSKCPTLWNQIAIYQGTFHAHKVPTLSLPWQITFYNDILSQKFAFLK